MEKVDLRHEKALGHLTRGCLAFDGVARWVTTAARLQPAFRRAGAGFEWALISPQALADAHPRLRLIDDVSVVELMTASCHNPLLRAALEAMGRVPAGRNAMRLVRYRFAA